MGGMASSPGKPVEPADNRDLQSRYEALRLRLEATLNAAVEALVITDERGIIETFNPAAESMFGYRAEEVIGLNVACLMPKPDHDRHDRYISDYKQTGNRRIIGIGRETWGRRKDGTQFPIDLAIGEIRTEPRKFIGTIRDITWRKSAEAALSAREAELRLLIDNAPVGIFMSDSDCRIRAVNPAFCRLIGRPATELVGTIFDELVSSEEREAMIVHRRTIASGGTPGTLEISIVRGDASVARCDLNCGMTVVDDEQLFIGQIVDRSTEFAMEAEMRDQRERLAHVGRLLTMGEMASGIAHEITQPLTAIATYAQATRRMFANGINNQAAFSEALEQIAKQAERAGDIIQRLRGFMRREETHSELVDINEQLRAVVRLADVDLRHHDTRVEWLLTTGLPAVQADAIQVQQVALNLIRNAIDAMDGAGVRSRVVTIRSWRADNRNVEFSVADRGPGIRLEDRERLFAPFFTTKSQGMGLGLSISSSIVQSFGGRLWYSEAPGGGAQFNVSLPAIGP
jgi:two-component system sensor kinase FixL